MASRKAKALLKQAGYPNGFETEIWTLPVSRPYNPNGKKMGEMMQQDLAKIGIKAKLITYDWPTYLAKSRKGEHQMIQMGWTGDNGDPDNFNINDCTTQRNLSKNGIIQSKKIGLFFEKNKIKIDKVLSSEWCRCKDTAKIAFKNFETFDALNSFYDEKFASNEDIQIKNLKKYIKSWESDKNLILVTHFVVISSILNMGTSSGEMIISDKNYNIIDNKIFNDF